MPTRIDDLPQMTAKYVIVRNADWVDKIVFTLPPTTVEGNPEPIDITGIAFYSQIRPAENDPRVILALSTPDGTLVNQGNNATLRWHVLFDIIKDIDSVFENAVLDLLAVADGKRINLYQEFGPAPVSIHPGVTWPRELT